LIVDIVPAEPSGFWVLEAAGRLLHWSPELGVEQDFPLAPLESAWALAVVGDRALVTGRGQDDAVAAWVDLGDGRVLATTDATSDAYNVAVSHDRKVFTTGRGDGSVEVRSLPDLVVAARIASLDTFVGVEILRSGNLVISGFDGALRVYHPDTGEEIGRIQISSHALLSVQELRTGELLVLDSEGVLTTLALPAAED
jgi:hypothetical protein